MYAYDYMAMAYQLFGVKSLPDTFWKNNEMRVKI